MLDMLLASIYSAQREYFLYYRLYIIHGVLSVQGNVSQQILYIPSEELQISNNYKFWLKSTISISF